MKNENEETKIKRTQRIEDKIKDKNWRSTKGRE